MFFYHEKGLLLPALCGLIVLSVATGFFHEDGFADVADSFGVPKLDSTPETMQKIEAALRDSRLGSFGVNATVLLWVARVSGVSSEDLTIPLIAVNILLSRETPLLIAPHFFQRATHHPSKASHFLSGLNPNARLVTFALMLPTAVLLLLPSMSLHDAAITVLAVVTSSALIASLSMSALNKRLGHLNGDCVGATICFSEICGILTIVALC